MTVPYLPTAELRVRRVAAQAIVTATPTDISWDTEDFDSLGAPGFITVPSTTVTLPATFPGIYSFMLQVTAAAPLAGLSYLQINGGGQIYRQNIDAGETTAAMGIMLRIPSPITFGVLHNAGVNVNFTARMHMFFTYG